MSEHLNETVSALLDGELEGAQLRAAEMHLMDCAECQALLEELKAIKRDARALDDVPPARDLWAGIAQRIADEPAQGIVAIGSRRKRIAFSVPQLAAAAALLMVMSGGAAVLVLRVSAPPVASHQTPAGQAPRDVGPLTVSNASNSPSDSAVATYDAAINDLEVTLRARRTRLDTSTVRIVEQSLVVIDLAIRQARAALERDPNNLYLNTHLQDALDRKLDLLRHVATLPTVS